MWEKIEMQKKKKKKTLEWWHQNINQPPPPPLRPPHISHSPINTMDMAFLVERQSNKCGSVSKEWWNNQLTLGIWCKFLSKHPLSPARHHPQLLTPSVQTINQEKNKEFKN